MELLEDELEILLLELDVLLNVLSLEDVLFILEVDSIDEDWSLLPLLLKIGFEQAVSTNNEINGNSFFISSVLINDAYL